MIALAALRCCGVTEASSTPLTWAATKRWMSTSDGERGLERRVAREVGEHAQFDLAVFGGDEHAAGSGHETLRGSRDRGHSSGDVLQIRLVRAQAPGLGAGLAKTGVDAAGLSVDVIRPAASGRCR